MPGSANRVSLLSAQKNYSEYGASERHKLDSVRPPDDSDRHERDWRPLDRAIDNPEEPQRGIDYAISYPQDTTVLYYWRETYWRRVVA